MLYHDLGHDQMRLQVLYIALLLLFLLSIAVPHVLGGFPVSGRFSLQVDA